jgi:hypothetical protein
VGKNSGVDLGRPTGTELDELPNSTTAKKSPKYVRGNLLVTGHMNFPKDFDSSETNSRKGIKREERNSPLFSTTKCSA